MARRPQRRRQGTRRRRTPGRPRPDPLRRTRTGDPVPRSRRCAQLSGRGAHGRRAHHVHRRGGSGRSGAPCRTGRARGRQLLDRFDDLRRGPGPVRARSAATTGNRWAPSRSAIRPSRPVHANRRRPTACWCASEPARLHNRGAGGLGGARPRAGHAAACGAVVRARPRGCVQAGMRAGSCHRLRTGARPHRDTGPADAASAVRALAAARRPLRGR